VEADKVDAAVDVKERKLYLSECPFNKIPEV
jgi:hypothetical protein